MSEATTAAPSIAATNPTIQGQSGTTASTPTPANGAQPGDVKAAAEEVARKLKYKTKEGKEEEVDESEVLRVYRERKQHQSEASRILNEGKALRRQAEQIITMIKDPEQVWDLIEKLGHNSRSLAEKRLAAHLEDELMDPKEKELKLTRLKLQEYEAKEKKAKEELQRKALEAQTAKLREKFDQEFRSVLDKSKLPKTKQTVAKMAGYVMRGAKLAEPITVEEAARLVEEDLRIEHQSIAGEADIETLLRVYGEDFFNKLRKYDTSRLKNPETNLRTPTEQSLEPRERNKPKQRMSTREWQLHKRGLK